LEAVFVVREYFRPLCGNQYCNHQHSCRPTVSGASGSSDMSHTICYSFSIEMQRKIDVMIL